MNHRRLISRTTVRTVVAALATLVSLAFLAIACGPGSGNGVPSPTEGVDITVNVVGDGRVLSTAIGLSCTDTCTVTVAEGTAVSLAGLAGSGQVLAAWEGPCPPFGGSCGWTAREDAEVTVTFAPHALRLDLRGDGEGSFQIAGGGIDTVCRDICFVTMQQPLALALQYDPEGSTRTSLSPWGGACAGAGDPTYCLVQVQGATTVSKTWRHPPIAEDHEYSTDQATPLTVPAPGVLLDVDDTPGDTHTASIVSQPSNGLLEPRTDGSFTYTPSPGFAGIDAFTFQVTDAFGNTDRGRADITVWPRLTLTKSGSGSVSSDPAGIDCDETCTTEVAFFEPNEQVTLQATPAEDSAFVAWAGVTCGEASQTAATCSFGVTAGTDVSATFETASYDVTVTIDGSGGGNVFSTPPGIDVEAGATTFAFDHGTLVTLTAEADDLSLFAEWSPGPCADELDPVCTFEITEDVEAEAVFDLEPTIDLP